MTQRTLGVLILCGLLAAAPGFGQPQTQVVHTDPAVTSDAGPETPAGYRLGPGDVISIAVSGLPQFDRILHVSNSGKVHVPYLGVLKVAGMTLSEFESDIRRRVVEKDLMSEPWVIVRLVDQRAETVYILGEVNMPGQYILRGEMYLIDLIALGMGITPVAETESRIGYLYRRQSLAENPEASTLSAAIRIDFSELLNGVRPDLNVRLKGGDILYCPATPKEFFYLVGEIHRPGAIELPARRDVSLTEAIAWAGGPTRTAKVAEGILVRYDQHGERQEIAVDFNAILVGKDANLTVKAGDVIFIPGSKVKTLGYGILNVIPGVATSAFVF
jgi:polysaccharide export outer membrane protein